MIPERVKQILNSHGLSALEFEPGSTPTSELAAARIGVAVGQIAKSMLFKGKNGSFFLAVCPGDRRVCSKKMKNETGTKVRMARGDETETVTGFRPGGVCPFGVEGVETLLDIGLAEYPLIYPAAGNDASGVPVTFEQLKQITGGRVVDVMER
ncbi:YbaK/EbsC family protein [Sedimenticola hydrogenitrophicus]|uniref:YbaK/EbsC family protein n=1 Tax=Sedimenticola hydrogenitrophicus TaxID=2967975 RepID=UPI0023AED6D4|nr:YbaK/EbsC family protein [Sedimenticola hydrogenitrophicus]